MAAEAEGLQIRPLDGNYKTRLTRIGLLMEGLGQGHSTCGPDYRSATITSAHQVHGTSFREEIINQPHAKYPHGYAVVRIDMPVSQSNPEDSFAVLKVFSSAVSAEEESIRLNKVNAQKGCKYIVLVTHLVSEK